MFGVSAALTTPFDTDGSIAHARLEKHIGKALGDGCTSVTFFGTTGEGASVSEGERRDAVASAVGAGFDADRFILTLHGAAAGDVIDQIRAARAMGVRRFLLPPPCYFAAPPDDGLFNWFAQVLSPFASSDMRFILYHIPQVIGVELPDAVVMRLANAFPGLVLGVKDSSGSLDKARGLLELPGLEILIGDERLLATCARLGASGTISGIANLFPARLARVLSSGQDDDDVNALIGTVLKYPVTPAIKSLVAHKYDDPSWRNTRAPLLATTDDEHLDLAHAHDAVVASGGQPTEVA